MKKNVIKKIAIRKILLTMLLLLALTFGAAQVCLAANAPVYLEGELIAYAEKEGDYYMVPLRDMLAKFDLEMKWSKDEVGEPCILVDMPDESVLYIYPYRSEYNQTDFGFVYPNSYSWSSSANPKPFVRNDVMYVGLGAFAWWLNWDWVSDDSSGVNLRYARTVYEDQNSGDFYELNLHTGELQKNGQLLSVLELPNFRKLHHVGVLYVSQTEGGNYVAQLDTSYYIETRHNNYNFYYINAASGQNYHTSTLCCKPEYIWVDYEFQPWPVQLNGQLWLSGNSELWQFEDKPTADAAVKHYDTISMLEKVLGRRPEIAYCWWTDCQRYLLLSDCENLVFYDMQTETGLDLNPLLLTDFSLNCANDYLRKAAPDIYNSEAALNEFWLRLGKYNELPSFVSLPWLRFDRVSEGVLYFELSVVFYNSVGNSSLQVLPLSLSLEQIKGLMK